MNIVNFQKFVERIDPRLNKDERKEKIIQIAESSQFTECYSENLVLMDCIQYEINIVENNGIKTGVLFCDLNKLKKRSFHPSLYTPFTSDFFREQANIHDFWFVFVEETPHIQFKKFTDFIEEHKLKDYYSKIFLFRFFESTIHQLK